MERVRKLIDERLDTKGHSVVLRNHADTMLTTPFATVSNLRETFAEVAAAADTDEDILMLYIGGKGVKGGRIPGALPPLDLVALTPAGLKSLLDDAGFEWRIVIVAACYAGAYADVARRRSHRRRRRVGDRPAVVRLRRPRRPDVLRRCAVQPPASRAAIRWSSAFDVARDRVAAREAERGLSRVAAGDARRRAHRADDPPPAPLRRRQQRSPRRAAATRRARDLARRV